MESTQAAFGSMGTGTDVIKKDKKFLFLSIILPLLLLIFTVLSIIDSGFYESSRSRNYARTESGKHEIKNAGKFNILSNQDLNSLIKDTVYTDKDCWLELRINEQMLYQHWRDGRTEKYPISSGNKYADAEALESRPGLFAIFLKIEHHQSTQFNSANMYNFMPFNQGIGFHAIDGTAYYANLGVRPSSHGCIRMKHQDAKKLFNDCPTGTLVLALKDYSARTVAFAPPGFKNAREYTKDDYKRMLALNLYNLMNGRYYVEERERFVIDPKMIPVSGVYVSYDVRIPDKQVIPRSYISFSELPDKVKIVTSQEVLHDEHSEELIKLVDYVEEGEGSNEQNDGIEIHSTDELIKKYFHNPIGILPYFGPK